MYVCVGGITDCFCYSAVRNGGVDHESQFSAATRILKCGDNDDKQFSYGQTQYI